MNITLRRTPEFLLVEDNPGDAELIQEAFSLSENTIHIDWVKDGEEALNFLYKREKFMHALTPDLILLDLNLPKKDGREVLMEIKNTDILKRIPVIIFTSSIAEKDISRAYNLHANCYLPKPSTFEKFKQTAKEIENFWLTLASIPDKNHYMKTHNNGL